MIKENSNALLVVDIQNDFCPGGALAVPDGDSIIPIVNTLMPTFFKVIATQDWHPYDHVSFAVQHPGKQVYDVVDVRGMPQVLWPEHCVAGTEGAALHSDINQAHIDLVLRKGCNAALDSYSAFFENDHKTATGLEGYLKGLGITQVFLTGLATDYCVFFSALDAAKLGFETYLVLDACQGIDVPENNVQRAITTMKQHKVQIINTTEEGLQ